MASSEVRTLNLQVARAYLSVSEQHLLTEHGSVALSFSSSDSVPDFLMYFGLFILFNWKRKEREKRKC